MIWQPCAIGCMQVSVGIKALPVLNEMDKYLCVFGANWTVTIGSVSPNEIKCWTPAPQLLVPFFQSHLTGECVTSSSDAIMTSSLGRSLVPANQP